MKVDIDYTAYSLQEALTGLKEIKKECNLEDCTVRVRIRPEPIKAAAMCADSLRKELEKHMVQF